MSRDIPGVLKLFERWYDLKSPSDNEFDARLRPHITNGQLNSALREAWPLFKTRMVEAFGLDNELDGNELANKLFGSEGSTAGILTNFEREGYLNLFKGMYALNRNPVSHNDVETNPEEAGAVLALINSALVRVEAPSAESVSESSDGMSK